MSIRIYRPFQVGILSFLLLLCVPLAAQQPSDDPAQSTGQAAPSAGQQQTSPQNLQAISQTGLLPVYGVDVRLDPAWVDSSQFPSQSPGFPNSGTTAAFQQVWGALQSGGYNVMRVPIDVRDAAGAANRAANLCLWAKNNNVQLILLLTGSDPGQPIGRDYPTQASSFVQSLVRLVRSNNGQYLANYSQIMSYQIEDELNHAGRHGGMAASAAQQLILQAAQALRKAESDALNGSGLAATPLMASTSFDFELIKAGAIAGGTLTDAAYSQAYQSLKQVLVGLAGSTDLDLLSVDWFAGSVGGGGVEKAPALLKSLMADVSGKQLVLTTGFSTAFRSADEQKRLYTMAFANLSDLRASAGADCPFVGTIFREALNGNNPNPNPPRPTLPGEMDKWDWQAKAAELTAMWTQNKTSDDMSWWLAKVDNNMGLVTLQNDASGNVAVNPLPAQQGMTQIASTVSDVNASMATNPAMNFSGQPTGAPSNPSVDPSATGAGSTPSPFVMGLQGAVQKGMLGLLDNVFQRLGTMSASVGGQGFNNPNNAAAQYNNNAYNNNGAPGNPYNYYNGNAPGTQPGGQPAASYGGQPGGQQGGYTGGQPGGAASGSVQLGPQDVSLQPTNPQVGSPVTINVNLRNVGGTDVYGLMVMAVGDDNFTLAQTDSVHIAPNSNTPVPLQWIPATAKPSYQITVNVGDGSGNQLASTPLSAVTVTAIQAAPNNTVTGAPDSGGGSSPAGGTAGTPTTGDIGGAMPGGTAGASGGGALSTVTPLGAVKLVGIQVGNTTDSPSPGQQSPVVVAVANPYLVPLNNIKATLMVDGKDVQTQTMGVLLPQQNRSLLFQGVNFPQAGQHEVKVRVDSQRPGAQPQTGTATQRIVIRAGTKASPGRSGVAGTGGTARGAGPSAQGNTGTTVAQAGKAGLGPPMVPPVRSVMPRSFQIGKTTVVPTGAGSVPGNTTGSTRNSASAPSTGTPARVGTAATTGSPGTPVVAMPMKSGSTGATASAGTTGATPAPPTGAPVRIIGGGTTVSPPPNSGVPLRPGQPVTKGATGTTGATPAPPTGAPVRIIGGGTTVSPPPNSGVAVRPGPGVPTGATGTAGATPAPPPPTRAPVRPGQTSTTTMTTPPSTGLPPRPGLSGTTGTPGTTGAPGTPVTSGKAAPATATTQVNVNLSVSSGDIRFSPTPPRTGQSTTFTAVIRNNGTSAAQGASVVFRLIADGRQVAVSAPQPFNITGRGTFQASWSTAIPMGQQMQLVVSVTANGVNNQGTVSFAVPRQNAPLKR